MFVGAAGAYFFNTQLHCHPLSFLQLKPTYNYSPLHLLVSCVLAVAVHISSSFDTHVSSFSNCTSSLGNSCLRREFSSLLSFSLVRLLFSSPSYKLSSSCIYGAMIAFIALLGLAADNQALSSVS